jgi:hypothetical protein
LSLHLIWNLRAMLVFLPLFSLLVLFTAVACQAKSASPFTLGPGQTLFSGGATGGKGPVMTHPRNGFEKCTSCHYPGTTGALHLVPKVHSCDECHVMQPMLSFSHGVPDNNACVICHTEP